MSINDGKVSLVASLVTPPGAEQVVLTNEQADEYRRDPDGFAAAYFGLTRDDYREWLELDGGALCGATTKAGKLCSHMVSKTQLSAREWKERHRSEYCTTHGGS
jgi:hypothetical protein